jgi:hypothetical protein
VLVFTLCTGRLDISNVLFRFRIRFVFHISSLFLFLFFFFFLICINSFSICLMENDSKFFACYFKSLFIYGVILKHK